MAKIRDCSLNDLAEEFLNSETYKQIILDNPALSIDKPTIQGCVCICIEEDTIDEFSCPTCTSFDCVLTAVRKGFCDQRIKTPCNACAEWIEALRSPSAFSHAAMCGRQILHGYALESGEELELRQLKCCLTKPLGHICNVYVSCITVHLCNASIRFHFAMPYLRGGQNSPDMLLHVRRLVGF
jgi:hypothetical protein